MARKRVEERGSVEKEESEDQETRKKEGGDDGGGGGEGKGASGTRKHNLGRGGG